MINSRGLFFTFCILKFFFLTSCTNSFDKENFLLCQPKLEKDRKKVRAEGGYSYEASSYDECRSPARYQL